LKIGPRTDAFLKEMIKKYGPKIVAEFKEKKKKEREEKKDAK
jgi:hypothetical protein